MTPREAILGKIRNQISGDQKDASRRAAVANRLSNAPRGVIPKRGQLAPAKQKDLFCEKAEAVRRARKLARKKLQREGLA